MLSFLAVRIAVVALMALVLTFIPDDLFFGWLTIGGGTVGLLLLIIDELRQHRHEVERDEAGAAFPSTLHADM